MQGNQRDNSRLKDQTMATTYKAVFVGSQKTEMERRFEKHRSGERKHSKKKHGLCTSPIEQQEQLLELSNLVAAF